MQHPHARYGYISLAQIRVAYGYYLKRLKEKLLTIDLPDPRKLDNNSDFIYIYKHHPSNACLVHTSGPILVIGTLT